MLHESTKPLVDTIVQIEHNLQQELNKALLAKLLYESEWLPISNSNVTRSEECI